MSETLFDDPVWQAVRDARPAPAADGDSPSTPAAQALLVRLVTAKAPAPRHIPVWRGSRIAKRVIAIGLPVAVALGVVAVAVSDLGHRPAPAVHASGHAARGPALRDAMFVAPHSFVVPGSAKVIARVSDPHGGLPWGVREIQTSRGQVCLIAGRLRGEELGVLGTYGAWGDDGRFHALPLQGSVVSLQTYCGQVDGNHHAFLNITQTAAIANAAGEAATDGAAHGKAARTELCPASSPAGRYSSAPPPRCPSGSLRDLAFGLLGPQAASITYLTSDGQIATQPTTGPDGAYLIVAPHRPSSCGPQTSLKRTCITAVDADGPRLQSGSIVAVHYRTGQVCRLPKPGPRGFVRTASCPLVGYQAPKTPHVTAADVASPVSVRIAPAAHYCASNAPNPPGCKEIDLKIAFTARVAVANLNSFYEAVIDMPPRHYKPGGPAGCPGGGGAIGPVQTTNTAGQRIHWTFPGAEYPKDCAGNTIHVTVAYVPDAFLGLNGIGSAPGASPGRGAIIVGRGAVTVPPL